MLVPLLRSYHFDFGEGHLGLTAEVNAASRQEAVERLRDYLPEEVAVFGDDDPELVIDVEIQINAFGLTTHDIVEEYALPDITLAECLKQWIEEQGSDLEIEWVEVPHPMIAAGGKQLVPGPYRVLVFGSGPRDADQAAEVTVTAVADGFDLDGDELLRQLEEQL